MIVPSLSTAKRARFSYASSMVKYLNTLLATGCKVYLGDDREVCTFTYIFGDSHIKAFVDNNSGSNIQDLSECTQLLDINKGHGFTLRFMADTPEGYE